MEGKLFKAFVVLCCFSIAYSGGPSFTDEYTFEESSSEPSPPGTLGPSSSGFFNSCVDCSWRTFGSCACFAAPNEVVYTIVNRRTGQVAGCCSSANRVSFNYISKFQVIIYFLTESKWNTFLNTIWDSSLQPWFQCVNLKKNL